MPAAAAATISAAQVIGFRENDHAARIKIKIARQQGLRRMVGTLLMEAGHAGAAEAGFIAELRRHLREQFIGDVCSFAPTWTLVGGGGAKLAVIWLTAQRATFRSTRR